MSDTEDPPALAESLLRRCLPPGPVRESVLGDVQEQYHHRVRRLGAGKAKVWYVRQAISIGAGYALRRLRGSRDYRSVALGSTSRTTAWSSGFDPLREAGLALRQMARNPGFAFVALTTLALGIGASTAAISASLATFRPSLPFSDADRLVRIYLVPASRPVRLSPRSPVLQEVVTASSTLDRVAASRFTNLTLRTPEGPERVIGNAVSPGWLETLGVNPILGRGFTEAEQEAGGESGTVLVSHGAWQSRFGGADILGRIIGLNDTPRTIIGVMPEGFAYPYNAEFWFPFRPDLTSDQGLWALNIKGRLAPGVTHAQLSGELAVISERARGRVEAMGDDMTLTAVPIREVLLDGEGRTVGWLLAAAGFLLLIVGTNLASLMLARGMGRAGDFAVRSSLGATFGRLARQTLMESLALTMVGGAAGLALAWLALGIVGPLVPDDLQSVHGPLRLSGQAVAVAVALTMGTGIIVGLVPALRLAATAPATTLRRGGRSLVGQGRGHLTTLLVVGELAAALVLLAGVGVMIRGFQDAQRVELGYDDDDMLVFSVALDREPLTDGPARIQFQDRIIEELSALPGISAAGATSMFPRHQGNLVAQLAAEGQSEDEGQLVNANDRLVSDGYLQGLGATLAAGRYLTPGDGAESEPVAIVGASLANRLWPNSNPIGRRLRNVRDGDEAPLYTVVGVVNEVREADDIPYTWYRPYDQEAGSRAARAMTFFTRGGMSGPPSVRTVREIMDLVAPTLPMFEVTTAASINSEGLARERNGAWYGTVFALLGMGLAAMGVYGAVSGVVARRRREFGIRLALGESPRSILFDLSRRVGAMLAAGAALGGLGGAALMTVLGARIGEVPGWNPWIFLAASSVLAITAGAGAAIPTLRAVRLPPHVVLAGE